MPCVKPVTPSPSKATAPKAVSAVRSLRRGRMASDPLIELRSTEADIRQLEKRSGNAFHSPRFAATNPDAAFATAAIVWAERQLSKLGGGDGRRGLLPDVLSRRRRSARSC